MSEPRPGRVRPTVFLHLGEPKTATTFLQHVMRSNLEPLAAHGVRMPGANQQVVFRATQDLRDQIKRDDDPAPSWDGEWDRLAHEAVHAPRVGIISHELLCAADDEQVAHAVGSLAGADVHVVLTVRDMASLLPAEWQESIKHRNTRAWDDWLAGVIDEEFSEAGAFAGFGPQPDDRRRDFWFWRVHDTARILQLWAAHVPAANVHVLTVPPRGADRTLVWRRFAQLIGVPADAVDVGAVRGNESLGLAEVEVLRRLNMKLSAQVPGWYYMANVKEPLAHGVLARRPSRGRLELPAERMPWAQQYAEHLITALDGAGYDIVGDLDELRPAAPSGEALHPSDITDEELLDAALAANVGALQRRYRRMTAAPDRTRAPGEMLLGALKSNPDLRRRLYDLSDRNRLVGAARTRLRGAIERARDGE